MDGVGKTVSATPGEERLAAFSAWLEMQTDELDLEAKQVLDRLKQLGAEVGTVSAVRNWLRGDNWVDEAHLPHLLAVLWGELKEQVGADETRLVKWCGVCLDALALYGTCAADLRGDDGSATTREVIGRLQTIEQADKRWGYPPGALSKTLATRKIMEGAVEALLSVLGLRQPRYRALVLYGGSGHGQATLARQLEADERLRNWYRGGIVWMNLQGVRHEAGVQAHLLKLLEIPSGPEALSTLRRLLGDPARRFLLILEGVDDWNSVSEMLRWLGSQAQVLVTTSALAPARECLTDIWEAGAVTCRQVLSFSEAEAREMAAHHDVPVPSGAEESAFLECWRRVGGHPEMLKALLLHSQRHTWADICAALREPRVDLAFAGVSLGRLTLIQKDVNRLPPTSRDYVQQLYEALWAAETFELLAAEMAWGIPAPAAQVMLEQFEAAGLIESDGPGTAYRLLPMVKAALLTKEKALSTNAASPLGGALPSDGDAGPMDKGNSPQPRHARLREQWLNRLRPEQVRAYLALRAGLSPATQMAWDQCWELPWVKYYSRAALAVLWRCSEADAELIIAELARRSLVKAGLNGEGQVTGCAFQRGTLHFAEYRAALRGECLTDAEKLTRPWIERYARSAAGRAELWLVWCEMSKVQFRDWFSMMRASWQKRTVPFWQALLNYFETHRKQSQMLAEMPDLTLAQWVVAVRHRQRDTRVHKGVFVWAVCAPTVWAMGQVPAIHQNIYVMLPLLLLLIGLTFAGFFVTGSLYKVLFDWHRLAVVVDPVDVLAYQA